QWRLFFQSLQEERGAVEAEVSGPSWGRPLEELMQDGKSDFVAALTGDYVGAERQIRDRLQARAQAAGFDLSMAASLRATQDSIRALMLIRAYRVMGHLIADLDPLGLSERSVHRELKPETYGFTE